MEDLTVAVDTEKVVATMAKLRNQKTRKDGVVVTHVTCEMPMATFEKLEARVKADNSSRSALMRKFIEAGLEEVSA